MKNYGALLLFLLSSPVLAQVNLGAASSAGINAQSSTPGTSQTANFNINGTGLITNGTQGVQLTAGQMDIYGLSGSGYLDWWKSTIGDTGSAAFRWGFNNSVFELRSLQSGGNVQIMSFDGLGRNMTINTGVHILPTDTNAYNSTGLTVSRSASTFNMNFDINGQSTDPGSASQGNVWALQAGAGYQLKLYSDRQVFIAGAGAARGNWTALTVGILANVTNFSGAFKASNETPKFGNISCSATVAGVGGTTGIVIKVRNVTDSTDLCSCTLGACTTTAGTPLTCSCNTTGVVSKAYTLEYATTTDCATNPSGFVCNVEQIQ